MKNKKVLFLDYFGVIKPVNSFLFTPKLISSLSKIMEQNEFYIVIVDLDEQNLSDDNKKVINFLSREGIVFDEFGLQSFDYSYFDINNSIYITSQINNKDKIKESKTILFSDKIGFSNLFFKVTNDWTEIVSILLNNQNQRSDRKAKIDRKTRETNISLNLNLDGTVENSSFNTGIGFFDHMLQQITAHSNIGISLKMEGDLQVDEHHSVEDVAIVFGEAVRTAIGDKRGLSRYGYWILPMDEVQSTVALDFSGRPELIWNVELNREYIGTFPTEMFYHFFKSFSYSSGCTLHISCTKGNSHHMIEAVFKAFSKALKMAVSRCPYSNSLPSSKGVL